MKEFTTFDKLADGHAFRFTGSATTIWIRLSEWSMRSLGSDKVIPLWGENGHPPRNPVVREQWADCMTGIQATK